LTINNEKQACDSRIRDLRLEELGVRAGRQMDFLWPQIPAAKIMKENCCCGHIGAAKSL
jgi:hypothetical protein